jgi:hypothetical protein
MIERFFEDSTDGLIFIKSKITPEERKRSKELLSIIYPVNRESQKESVKSGAIDNRQV